MKKYRAQQLVNYAVRTGKLVRPDSCEICYKTSVKINGHHDNYSKLLEVVWVCTSCHRKMHPRPMDFKRVLIPRQDPRADKIIQLLYGV